MMGRRGHGKSLILAVAYLVVCAGYVAAQETDPATALLTIARKEDN